MLTHLPLQYLHYVSNADDHASSRMVYTIAVAGISLLVSLVCMIPFEFMFFGFILDFALFVMWMVSFGLLENVHHPPTLSNFYP
jgi:hypothetical protein